jgi:hypothetical protein
MWQHGSGQNGTQESAATQVNSQHESRQVKQTAENHDI